MLANLKLSTRIVALGVGIVICFLPVFIWLQPKLKQNMYDAKYLKTRHLVESAWGVINHFVGQSQSGAMSLKQAQTAAQAAIREMRYEQKDYFWINDTHPRMVMHPIKPKLDGKDLSDFKDPNGKRLFVEFVRVSQKAGGGFVDYYWPKPGETDPVPKISYVKLIPEWGWIVGSGIYINDAEKEITRLFLIIYSIVAVITIIGILLSFWMARSITKPIEKTVQGLHQGAEQISAASQEVAASSQSLAESATEQAAAVQESSATLEEMNAMSRETSDLTVGAGHLMNKNIEKSGQSLKALIDVTRKMSQIEADSDKIGQIIKTIDEIAFQTNLLALNAAVEAARAGEAGAGFAVVADEVRNLAIRATEAAKDTQELLDNTVKGINDSASSIKSVNSDFEGIIESATVLGEKTAGISEASREVANGISQISNATHEIDNVTQRTAASAEESAAAAEELSAQADQMNGFVEVLTTIVQGQRHSQKIEATQTKGGGNLQSHRRPPAVQRPPVPLTPSHQSTNEITPAQVIPLEEDEFKEF